MVQSAMKDSKDRVKMLTLNLDDFEPLAKDSLIASSSGHFFEENRSKLVPSFDRGVIVDNRTYDTQSDEIILGKKLGAGAFCDVMEISSITLKRKESDVDPFEMNEYLMPSEKYSSQKLDDNHDDDCNELDATDEAGFPRQGQFKDKSQIRSYMSTNCKRQSEEGEEQARYALKQLKVNDSEEYVRRGLVDLSIEAQFLSCLNHPNIIKMRGLTGIPFAPDFGIIMDRLYMTLDDKMEFWNEERKSALGKSMCGCLGFGFDKTTRDTIRFQAITVAYDMSCAMRYISGHNLIYRDTKPQNAGFDVRGDVKIFDFGFLRELRKDLYDCMSGQYKLTPCTGSVPYMAPEVFAGKPYGSPSDVYSFGVLLWEMLHFKFAFYHMSPTEYEEAIIKRNFRPSIDSSLPPMIRTIIKESWDSDPAKRPSFDRIAVLLKEEYQESMSDDKIGTRSERLAEKSMRSYRTRLKPVNSKEKYNILSI